MWSSITGSRQPARLRSEAQVCEGRAGTGNALWSSKTPPLEPQEDLCSLREGFLKNPGPKNLPVATPRDFGPFQVRQGATKHRA